VLRTRDAVTRAGGVWLSLAAVFVLYTLLAVATFLVLRSMARRWRRVDAAGVSDSDVPYGPARVLDPASASTPTRGAR
jgi:cytochrome d ubiquinol oxidase subunit I